MSYDLIAHYRRATAFPEKLATTLRYPTLDISPR
jgi:hypothetical protein